MEDKLIECFVRCSRCGRRVSNIVKSNIPEGLVVRAFIECAECVKKSCGNCDTPLLREGELEAKIEKALKGGGK